MEMNSCVLFLNHHFYIKAMLEKQEDKKEPINIDFCLVFSNLVLVNANLFYTFVACSRKAG